MLLVDGVCTLANVVIINPTQIDLVSLVVFSCGVVVTIPGKGWSLSRLVPNGHVSPSSYKGFWVSTQVGTWVSSSMCQHGVGGEMH